MPYDNSESSFVIRSTKRLIGRMEEVYRVRERRAARLKIEICSLLGNRLPKSEALPVRAQSCLAASGQAENSIRSERLKGCDAS